jgi:uncharacterized protein involved in exopolysaccharide biosynthesis
MNNLTPSPPDPCRKSTDSVEDYPAPARAFHAQKLLVFLWKYWRIPAITLTLTMGVVVGYILWIPPTYVSTGRLWEAEQFRLPEGSFFCEDLPNFVGTQTGLFRSEKLRQMALNTMRAAGTNNVLLGEDDQPLPVMIKITPVPKSTICMVEASSANPAYTQKYLDALMLAYIEFRKTIRQEVSGETLASISEQVQCLERDLKAAQDVFFTFQRTNNLAILQAEGPVAADRLGKLHAQLSDLQLEELLLNGSELSQAETAARRTLRLKLELVRNSIQEWEAKVADITARIVEADHLKSRITRPQNLYDRLVNLLDNVVISRKIQQSSWVVLTPASVAERSSSFEWWLLVVAGFSGLGLGLGMVLLMVWTRSVSPL